MSKWRYYFWLLSARKSKGSLLLGAWLIAFGLLLAFNWEFPYRDLILGLSAAVAGVLVLLDR